MNPSRQTSLPTTLRGVIPYLSFNGSAGAAADLYARVFDATNVARMPTPDKPGRFLHIQMEINSGTLMLCDHGDTDEKSEPRGHLQLVVTNASELWDRAVSCGMQVVCPFEQQFWGDLWGLLVDPYGIYWGIMQHVEEHHRATDAHHGDTQ